MGFVEVGSDVRMWAGLVGLCGVCGSWVRCQDVDRISRSVGFCGNWVRYQDVDRISRFVWGFWKLGKMLGCGQD